MLTRYIIALFILVGLMLEPVTSVKAQQARADYDYAYIGDPLPDPVMQHNKEVFVLYGCAYCHGIKLKPVGEAANLRISRIVGTDVASNIIGPILRNGIPQTPKSSPMPQFSDLSEQEIKAIASYIHYMRAEENHRMMMETVTTGDVAAGKLYFEKNCTSCHTRENLTGIGKKYDAVALREQVLVPTVFRTPLSFKVDRLNNTESLAARAKHQSFLENYEEPTVANLVAYLQTLK